MESLLTRKLKMAASTSRASTRLTVQMKTCPSPRNSRDPVNDRCTHSNYPENAATDYKLPPEVPISSFHWCAEATPPSSKYVFSSGLPGPMPKIASSACRRLRCSHGIFASFSLFHVSAAGPRQISLLAWIGDSSPLLSFLYFPLGSVASSGASVLCYRPIQKAQSYSFILRVAPLFFFFLFERVHSYGVIHKSIYGVLIRTSVPHCPVDVCTTFTGRHETYGAVGATIVTNTYPFRHRHKTRHTRTFGSGILLLR